MQWSIDPAHSSVEFTVKHMAVATVRGRFRTFEGIVEADEAGRPTGAEATIQAASIDTGADQRDGHLRSADFFEADRYPTLTFRATSVKPAGERKYTVTGDLTIRGITHPVTLEAEAAPPMKDPWGNQRIAFSASGKISRKEWGLNWNQALELGGVLVSDEVKLSLEVEAVAAQAAAA